MKLESIVTLANRNSRLMFLAMLRSLRATGNQLPVAVIPYDESRFDLPPGAEWVEHPPFYSWVKARCAHPMMRKYLALTFRNHHYLDTDALFLKDPAKVLAPHSGFVVCCTEWNKPKWTVTRETESRFRQRWSTWQKEIFCAGQFACDRQLYDAEGLMRFAEQPENRGACLEFSLHDQPGTNLMVLSTDVPRTNLTLPPHGMASSWAGDYDDAGAVTRGTNSPYLLHYAGGLLDQDHATNELFLNFLSKDERTEWDEQLRLRRLRQEKEARWPLPVRIINRLLPRLDKRFRVQWIGNNSS